ncbi:hypothetical protein BX616_001292 [Lobosporangium transversale]|uniref:Uncharacterized protein n=1 Tax=Lobosporangium transversale TaxID=64571 RepID=A0A1Y2GK32_9FUNG|nr:hypothetical protein BCR41DRAFT_94061 [Lobosporangium transversale]KAF9917349.1 hypothetical protein BX616_001292 [Lobosporangium transversale]ORZ13359.1 hypothetical protein BCR41DRAFT_94061 [Lobosporangium transversale]|eukprot:XP_021880440.1 hypothetical protein BCR41DRAFT_94061 [Lobosporangium transversale]
MIGALSKLYSSAFWPWSTSDGQLLRTLSDDELSAIVILGLMGLSIAGLYWDPMHFTIQRMPRIRIRERQYHIWARIGAVPLLVLQYLVLFIGQWKQNLTQLCSAILMLHIIYLLAFHTGRYLQEPLEFKLERQAISPPSSKVLSRNNALLENQHKTKKRESNAVSTSTRLAINSSELLHDGPRSRTDSPDIDQMSWSSNKPTLTSANHLSAAFGMYRDPNRHSEQESASFQPGSRPGSAEMFNNSFTAGNSNVKFHTRAYEPSPLANPSIIANMGLNNISLGEMLGFPSAKFQPPENHFAHRSARSQEQNETKSWSHREFTSETERSELNHSLAQLRRPLARSGFSDYTDADMNDEDDSLAFSSNHGPFGRDEKVKTPSSSGGSLESPRNCWTSDGRDLFAAQRYFPPEPETGLEDNFFGIVKIVDDYLPPQQGPRSIGGRNLMLKKRLARRWLILLLLCRTCFAWKFVFELSDALSWASQAMFIGVVIHATAFWALDEYRAVLRQMRKKTVAVEKKSPPEPNDPYEPRKVDHICSVRLCSDPCQVHWDVEHHKNI